MQRAGNDRAHFVDILCSCKFFVGITMKAKLCFNNNTSDFFGLQKHWVNANNVLHKAAKLLNRMFTLICTSFFCSKFSPLESNTFRENHDNKKASIEKSRKCWNSVRYYPLHAATLTMRTLILNAFMNESKHSELIEKIKNECGFRYTRLRRQISLLQNFLTGELEPPYVREIWKRQGKLGTSWSAHTVLRKVFKGHRPAHTRLRTRIDVYR